MSKNDHDCRGVPPWHPIAAEKDAEGVLRTMGAHGGTRLQFRGSFLILSGESFRELPGNKHEKENADYRRADCQTHQ